MLLLHVYWLYPFSHSLLFSMYFNFRYTLYYTRNYIIIFSSVQFTSVTQPCLTLCKPMDCSTSGLPVQHKLPEFTQTHVHWVSDAIQHLISVISFSFHLQSFPASGSFPMSQLFASGGQRIGVSTSILLMNTQDWSPLGWTGWISLPWQGALAQGTLKSLLWHHSSKASILQCSAFFIVQLSHPYMTTGKTIALNRWSSVGKKCLCFLICCLGWS